MTTEVPSAFGGGFTVLLPQGAPTNSVRWLSFELHQEIGKHDAAVIQVNSRGLDYINTMPAGTPITVNFHNNQGMADTFLGYVTKVTPVMTSDNQNLRAITCVATSRVLRETGRNTWRSRTAPEIVQEIGKKFGFKVVTKQHVLRKSHVVQGGDSYWQVLAKLARMTGYVLSVEGTTLYFLPLPDMVQAFMSAAPIYSEATKGPGALSPLLELSVTLGNTSDDPDDLADAAVVTSLGHHDVKAGTSRKEPSTVTKGIKVSKPTYERFNPTVVAHSRAEADALAQGMADRGLMAHDGYAYGYGSPLVRPYHPLYILSRDNNASGYWITKKVTHRISQFRYTSEAVISTDELSSFTPPAPNRSYRDVSVEAVNGWSPYTTGASILTPIIPSPTGSVALDVSSPMAPMFAIGDSYRADSQVAVWTSTDA